MELTRRFRALGGVRASPVLLLTAFGEVRDRLAGFDAGAVDYVVKPFEPAELVARVRSQLALRTLTLQLVESEKHAALGVLSTGLAHELRNPANGIVNAVAPLRELLPQEALREPGVEDLLGVISECSERVAAISKHLLGFRQGASIEPRSVSVETLLDRVRATAQPALTGVELRQRLAYRGPISCAEPLMTQVFANLLDNAAYAAGHGGWVEVSTGVERERVVVEFADSGAGVPVQLRERIFEPFFTTKPAGKGTGLGLATAREIVNRHGGSLTVCQSTSGRAVFRVEVPLHPVSP
jgi:signal transduction histidine kinase